MPYIVTTSQSSATIEPRGRSPAFAARAVRAAGCYACAVVRRVGVCTWDRGRRPVDMDGEPELLVPFRETVRVGCLCAPLIRSGPCVGSSDLRR